MAVQPGIAAVRQCPGGDCQVCGPHRNQGKKGALCIDQIKPEVFVAKRDRVYTFGPFTVQGKSKTTQQCMRSVVRKEKVVGGDESVEMNLVRLLVWNSMGTLGVFREIYWVSCGRSRCMVRFA